MALRRKYNSPPFEVMGLGGSSAGRRPAPPPPEPTVMDEAPRGEARQGLFERARTPMIVRLPRGYAALLGLVFVGLLCLSYGVGFSQGQKEGKTQAQGEYEAEQQALASARAPIQAPPGNAARGASTSNAANSSSNVAAVRQSPAPPPAASTVASAGQDPRQLDMNYLVLADYPADEANRLGQFLATQQVETVLVSRNNGRFHVVDLRPWAPGAVGEAEYRQHVARLKQLGRVWKQSHRGPTDLSDLWPQKFKPGR